MQEIWDNPALTENRLQNIVVVLDPQRRGKYIDFLLAWMDYLESKGGGFGDPDLDSLAYVSFCVDKRCQISFFQ